MSAHHIRSRFVWLAPLAALVLAACTGRATSGTDDKAGGDAEPIVLTLADYSFSPESVPALKDFVARVAALSNDLVRIDVRSNWGDGYHPDIEQRIVRDVAAGRVDMAWVGTRAFDSLGVNSFRALNAPMLIDNYPLLDQVIKSDMPGEMMKSLDDLGVVGVAIVADNSRHPVAVHRPLLSPADYEGITFTSAQSATLAEAVGALGAQWREAHSEERGRGLQEGEIDGFEHSLLQYSFNQTNWIAPYVTANVTLWANPVALIANPTTLDRLTDKQRNLIMDAGAAAAEHSTALVANEDDIVSGLCESGSRFANASTADLEAMRAAFEPVYTTLERDADTANFITQIEELKAKVDSGPPLQIPAGCTGEAPDQTGAVASSDATAAAVDPALLDGVYRWEITRSDADSLGDWPWKPGELDSFPWLFTVEMVDGKYTMSVTDANGVTENECTNGCTYTIAGDTLRMRPASSGPVESFKFTRDDDGTLHLHAFGSMDPGDAFVTTTEPWAQIEDRSGSTSPGDPSILDGVYRWVITKDDALAHGTPGDREPTNLATFPWLFTVQMEDGVWTISVTDANGVVDNECTQDCDYTIEGNEIHFGNGPNQPVETYRFTRDDDGTLHLEPVGIVNPGGVFVMTSEPWDRIEDRSGEASSDAASGASLDGTYRYGMSREEAAQYVSEGVLSADDLQFYPGFITLTLDDGVWSMTVDATDGKTPQCDTSDCTYEVQGDHIVFSWGDGLKDNFTFTLDEDQALHLQPDGIMSPDERLVWTIKPWERID